GGGSDPLGLRRRDAAEVARGNGGARRRPPHSSRRASPRQTCRARGVSRRNYGRYRPVPRCGARCHVWIAFLGVERVRLCLRRNEAAHSVHSPPPQAGEGWGGGELAHMTLVHAPSLSLPRKRGREQTEFAACADSISHECGLAEMLASIRRRLRSPRMMSHTT